MAKELDEIKQINKQVFDDRGRVHTTLGNVLFECAQPKGMARKKKIEFYTLAEQQYRIVVENKWGDVKWAVLAWDRFCLR